MKTMTISNTNRTAKPTVAYPNGLTRRQSFHKLLDVVLIAASGVGISAMLAFVLTVC